MDFPEPFSPTKNALVVWSAFSCTPPPKPVSLEGLTQDVQGPVSVTYNPFAGRPSFVRGRIPFGVLGLQATDTTQAVAYQLMKRYASLFGTDSTARDLEYVVVRGDPLGMRHMGMRQIYQGGDVYGAPPDEQGKGEEGASAHRIRLTWGREGDASSWQRSARY